MSATFLITLVVALLAIVYWRVVLILVGAVLLATVVTGISSMSDVMAGQATPPGSSAPQRPGPAPDGSTPDAGEATPGSAGDPGVSGQPPR